MIIFRMLTAEYSDKITISLFICSECYRKYYTLLMRILPKRHAFQSKEIKKFACEFCHADTVGCSEVTIDIDDVFASLQNITMASISMQKHPEIDKVLQDYRKFIAKTLERHLMMKKASFLDHILLKTNAHYQTLIQ